MLVLVLLALAGFGAAAQTPCAACSCAAGLPERARVAAADAVFVGAVTGRADSPAAADGSRGSDDPVVYAVTVSRVLKGRVEALVEVVSAASDASCGLPLSVSATYVFLARSEGGRWRVTLCDGTGLAAVRRAAVEGVTGAGAAGSRGEAGFGGGAGVGGWLRVVGVGLALALAGGLVAAYRKKRIAEPADDRRSP